MNDFAIVEQELKEEDLLLETHEELENGLGDDE